ncbi:MAG: replicative DNA helicase [Butyricicoccus sp.]
MKHILMNLEGDVRVLYQPLEAESTLVGCLLADPSRFADVSALVRADDFTNDLCRAIFETVQALTFDGAACDVVKILNRLVERGHGTEQEIRGWLMELMDCAPTATVAESAARALAEQSRRARLADLLAQGVESVRAGAPLPEIIGTVSQGLETVDSTGAGDLVSNTDAIVDFYNFRDRLERGENLTVCTGYPSMDALLGGGLLNSGLYVLAARPGVGKTTFALSIAENVSETGGVLFVSLEMDVSQLTAKRLARASGVSSSALMLRRDLTEDEHTRVGRASHTLSAHRLFVNKRARCTVSDVRSLARKVKGLRLVVIDYLGLLQPEGRANSRYESITKISNDLKALARVLQVPVLALAQLNRASETRQDKRPSMADLRDSGAIEQDADGIVFLYREDYYSEGGADSVPIEVSLAKNRHAGTGKVLMAFDKTHSDFLEVNQ